MKKPVCKFCGCEFFAIRDEDTPDWVIDGGYPLMGKVVRCSCPCHQYHASASVKTAYIKAFNKVFE